MSKKKVKNLLDKTFFYDENLTVKTFSSIFNYNFKDRNLLKSALTRQSAITENLPYAPSYSYQRLEFFGDGILSMVIAKYLFDSYPDKSEDQLSNMKSYIIKNDTLGCFAEKLGIGDYIIVGKGEELAGVRKNKKVLADVMEALVAAIFIDSENNFQLTENSIINLFKPIIGTVKFKDNKICFEDLNLINLTDFIINKTLLESTSKDEINLIETLKIESETNKNKGTYSFDDILQIPEINNLIKDNSLYEVELSINNENIINYLESHSCKTNLLEKLTQDIKCAYVNKELKELNLYSKLLLFIIINAENEISASIISKCFIYNAIIEYYKQEYNNSLYFMEIFSKICSNEPKHFQNSIQQMSINYKFKLFLKSGDFSLIENYVNYIQDGTINSLIYEYKENKEKEEILLNKINLILKEFNETLILNEIDLDKVITALSIKIKLDNKKDLNLKTLLYLEKVILAKTTENNLIYLIEVYTLIIEILKYKYNEDIDNENEDMYIVNLEHLISYYIKLLKIIQSIYPITSKIYLENLYSLRNYYNLILELSNK